jgi:hypothetical protein
MATAAVVTAFQAEVEADGDDYIKQKYRIQGILLGQALVAPFILVRRVSKDLETNLATRTATA